MQGIQHLVHNLGPHVSLSFLGAGGQMRRDNHIIILKQRTVRGERFLGKYVERRARDFAGLQAVNQGCFVDQSAARSIDNSDAIFHLGDGLSVDQVFGIGRKCGVDRNKIRAGQ